ncbi:MAG: polysaccharide deacetylase family protein [Halioglobus sp.]
MKNTAQFIARTLDASGVLGVMERLDKSSGLRVLVYHRIDDPAAEPDLDPGLISATPEAFREQMHLVAERYNPVSLHTVLAAQRGETSLPRAAVLITFDDAYLDFSMHAWPVLRDLGLPAVLFVPTAFPGCEEGTGFWWDRLYAGLRRAQERVVTLPDLGDFDTAGATNLRLALNACKRHVKSQPHGEAMDWVESALAELADIPPLARILSWDDLRALARQGLDVCGHGHSHALCTRLTVAELKEDLMTCQTRLIRELGGDACGSVIAWPANACNHQVCEIAQSLGFEMGFGGVRGVTKIPPMNPLDIMRIPVLRYQRALFRAQLRPGIAGLGRWMLETTGSGLQMTKRSMS